MIPDRAEIYSSIYGAWRLARLDPSGMRFFSLTIEGFWRSFFAAVIVAPIYIYIRLIRPIARVQMPQQPLDAPVVEGEPPVDAGPNLVVDIGAYVVGWAAFPVLMILLARLLNLSGQYVSFIVAYNWANVVQWAVFGVAATIAAALGAETGLGVVLNLAALAAVLFYQWFVARTALLTSAYVAAGIVVIDVLLGLIINFAARAVA